MEDNPLTLGETGAGVVGSYYLAELVPDEINVIRRLVSKDQARILGDAKLCEAYMKDYFPGRSPIRNALIAGVEVGFPLEYLEAKSPTDRIRVKRVAEERLKDRLIHAANSVWITDTWERILTNMHMGSPFRRSQSYMESLVWTPPLRQPSDLMLPRLTPTVQPASKSRASLAPVLGLVALGAILLGWWLGRIGWPLTSLTGRG
jgi:hypothetical protein